jgi:hypothetical protein
LLIWAGRCEFNKFVDFLKLFVKMCLTISFAGEFFVFFGSPTDQKLWVFEVLGEVQAAKKLFIF